MLRFSMDCRVKPGNDEFGLDAPAASSPGGFCGALNSNCEWLFSMDRRVKPGGDEGQGRLRVASPR